MAYAHTKILVLIATVFFGYVPPHNTCAGDIMDQCCRQVMANVMRHQQWLWECPDASYLPKGMIEQRYVPVDNGALVPLPPRHPWR